jgi:hypothetical protein
MNHESEPHRISREELIHYPFRHPDKTLTTIAQMTGAIAGGSLFFAGASQAASDDYEFQASEQGRIPKSIQEKTHLRNESQRMHEAAQKWFGQFIKYGRISFILAVIGQSLRDPQTEYFEKNPIEKYTP